ncbi:hypothetical protein ACJX0J_040438, partial [Zea mays]
MNGAVMQNYIRKIAKRYEGLLVGKTNSIFLLFLGHYGLYVDVTCGFLEKYYLSFQIWDSFPMNKYINKYREIMNGVVDAEEIKNSKKIVVYERGHFEGLWARPEAHEDRWHFHLYQKFQIWVVDALRKMKKIMCMLGWIPSAL